MKKIKDVINIIVMFLVLKVNAQDPNFTLFYNNLTYYNPAMTGINKG